MIRDEGAIKFKLHWSQTGPLDSEMLADLIACRNKCFQKNFIGVYQDSGIGFGNISQRYQDTDQFIISGSQTGHLAELSSNHFSRVTCVDFTDNRVDCSGPVKASSESMTHAMFYQLDPGIMCVIHIHHHDMWMRLLESAPATDIDVPYGTPAMCEAVDVLYRQSSLPDRKLLVMAGHEDGIISFGENFHQAFDTLCRA